MSVVPEEVSPTNNSDLKQIEIPVSKCPIDSLTIYNDRVELIRRVELSLEKGPHTISITDVSYDLITNSIHVSGGIGAATILEVSSQVNYQIESQQSKLAEKKQFRKELIKEKTKLSSQIEILMKKFDWINQWADSIKGTPQVQAKNSEKTGFLTGEYFQNVKNFIGFYTDQLAGLQKEKMALDNQMEELGSRIHGLDAEIIAPNKKPTKENLRNSILISLMAGGGQIVLQVAYVLQNASWSPSYNCRVDSGNSKVQLTYYAVITNKTGEDWINAKINLSTASPGEGGAPPKLETATVGPPGYRGEPKTRGRSSLVMGEMLQLGGNGRDESHRALGDGVLPIYPVSTMTTTASDSMICTTFSIPVPSTVISDNKEHKVTVAIIDLKTKFTYSVVPRRTPWAFLKSTTINNSAFFLLAGPCNVFIDSNFVATSSLRDVSPGEKFAFFLGPDKSIKVEYQKPSSVSDQVGLIKRSVSETWTGMINVKNTKNHEIPVTVYEQLPKSPDEKIKVTQIEPFLGTKGNVQTKLNQNNNIEVRSRINPGDTLKLTVKYVVDHPPNFDIEYNWG